MNRAGEFGLTRVQQFFIILLSVALLAYVIVAITGVLVANPVINTGTDIIAVSNESVNIASARVAGNSINPNVRFMLDSDHLLFNLVITNGTGFNIPGCIFQDEIECDSTENWSFTPETNNLTFGNNSYMVLGGGKNNITLASYSFNISGGSAQVEAILENTSRGIMSFFSAINPVYAILAIFVIITALLVIVHVLSYQRPSDQL